MGGPADAGGFVPLTSDFAWESAPGCTLVSAKAASLPKDSVANATQLFALDRRYLHARIGRLGPKLLEQILASIDIVLGR